MVDSEVSRDGPAADWFQTRLRYFLPAWRMADTYRSMFPAIMRPVVGWLPITVNIGHVPARRYTWGVLCSASSTVEAWGRLRATLHGRGIRDELMIPDQVFQRMVPAMAASRGLRTVVVKDEVLVVYLIYAIERGGIVARRLINVFNGSAYHDYLLTDDISEEVRRRLKISARLLRAAIDFYREVGVSRITMTAGLSDGGRVWPRYGFRPVDTANWRQCGPRIRANLARLPHSVQSHWRNYVVTRIASPDPKSIWSIRDIDEEVPHPCRPHELRQLGELLLERTRWQGELDLADATALARLTNALSLLDKE